MTEEQEGTRLGAPNSFPMNTETMPAAAAAPTPARRLLGRRVAIAAAVVLAVVAVRRSGLTDLVSDEDRLRRLVDDAGILAPMLFSFAFIALVPVGVPGLVFVLPAAVVFPAPVAIAVSLAGGYGSSAIGMWFARTIGRERMAAKLPPRFRAWDERIAARGLPAVIALRILTYLAAPADWLLGLTGISNRHLVLGTAVGLVPPTLLYVLVGGSVLDLVL